MLTPLSMAGQGRPPGGPSRTQSSLHEARGVPGPAWPHFRVGGACGCRRGHSTGYVLESTDRSPPINGAVLPLAPRQRLELRWREFFDYYPGFAEGEFALGY